MDERTVKVVVAKVKVHDIYYYTYIGVSSIADSTVEPLGFGK